MVIKRNINGYHASNNFSTYNIFNDRKIYKVLVAKNKKKFLKIMTDKYFKNI